MNELSRIQFQTTQDYSNYFSGRLLHRALEIKTPYRKWFPRVCAQNDYEEGVDFVTSDKIVRRADGVAMPHDLHDHLITVDVAKEICLAQHTAIGKLLRKKLIAQEKAALEARELELQSCQNQLARTVQQNEELSASLAVQKANMEAMGDLIERANAALILQRDALHRQTRQMDRLSGKISRQEKSIQKMTPKADYYDHVLTAPDTYSTTIIAKDCGTTGQKLNRFLHEQKVQYRLHDGWVLYAKYDGKGYTHTVTLIEKKDNCPEKVHIMTQWTQKGRQFIFQLMEKDNEHRKDEEKWKIPALSAEV